MKILSVTTSLPHSLNESSGIFVSHLLMALAKKHRVTVATSSYLGLRHLNPANPAMTVMSCRYGPAAWETLAHSPGGIPAAIMRNPWCGKLMLVSLTLSLALNSLIAGMRNDCIHANWSVSGLLVLPLKIMGKPLVVTLRGEDVTRAQSRWLSRLLLGLLIRVSNQTITVSKDMKLWIDSVYKLSHKTAFIGNGVSADFLAVGESRHYRQFFSPLRCIVVGSLIQRKNVQLIIAALNKISRAYSWTLSIVGDGPDKQHLEELVKQYALTDRVTFLGSKNTDEVIKELTYANVFLFGSRSEGRPNVIVEAMAAGLAVVAPRISGVTELVHHNENGLLFDADSVDGLYAAFNSLLSDAERVSHLGFAAHQSIKHEVGSWEQVADAYSNVFQSCLRGAPCVG